MVSRYTKGLESELTDSDSVMVGEAGILHLEGSPMLIRTALYTTLHLQHEGGYVFAFRSGCTWGRKHGSSFSLTYRTERCVSGSKTALVIGACMSGESFPCGKKVTLYTREIDRERQRGHVYDKVGRKM